MATVSVDIQFCKGCCLCASACPLGLMELNPDVFTPKGGHPAYCKDPEACTGCASCATMCPDCAITVKR